MGQNLGKLGVLHQGLTILGRGLQSFRVKSSCVLSHLVFLSHLQSFLPDRGQDRTLHESPVARILTDSGCRCSSESLETKTPLLPSPTKMKQKPWPTWTEHVFSVWMTVRRKKRDITKVETAVSRLYWIEGLIFLRVMRLDTFGSWIFSWTQGS